MAISRTRTGPEHNGASPVTKRIIRVEVECIGKIAH
jgi:hypothetical protein